MQVEYNPKELAIAESICSVILSGAFITRHPLKRDMKQNPDTDPSSVVSKLRDLILNLSTCNTHVMHVTHT